MTRYRIHLAAVLAAGALPALANITYQCDSSFTSDAPGGTCAYLNSTISSLYSGTFTNASANIYITFGSTGLGQSLTALNGYTFSQYQSAYQTNLTSVGNTDNANQTTAYNDNIATEPGIFGTNDILLTSALSDALGLGGTAGLDSSANNCTLGNAGCYNAIITITNVTSTLWFRGLSGGSPSGSQYDFFSVVEHETDEVLGTSSCLPNCSTSFNPVDLFRYSSNAVRTLTAGDNSANCSTASSTNACFTINNGATFINQWNNANNGDDFADWVSGCPGSPQIQDATGCPGFANLDITNDSGYEVDLLNAVGFDLQSGVPEPGTMFITAAGLALLVSRLGRRGSRA